MDRLERVEANQQTVLRKIDALLQSQLIVLRFIVELGKLKGAEMSKLHDDLKAIANDVDAAADRALAAKADSESALADVITQFTATRDKLNAAADDAAASQGSSASDAASQDGTHVDPTTFSAGASS